MDATLIIVDCDAELKRAQERVVQLMASDDPADRPILKAQACLVAVYEEQHWPRRQPTLAEIMDYLVDQHGLTRG
jgi:HTH-type transcriptional regulator/antitoxin HigA